MTDRKKLTLVTQPQAFFHELVTTALEKQNLAPRPETEFYLVNLLNQFMTTDKLFPKSPDGQSREEPLALLIKEAMEQPQAETQKSKFQHVGDFSLYVAGYFQDSLNRKLVDVDYYIGMGGTAYQQVAVRVEEHNQRTVFGELAEKFAAFVDVFARISDETRPKSEKDLLRLYDLWLKTRSERAAKALEEAGIIPNETIKKDWQ